MSSDILLFTPTDSPAQRAEIPSDTAAYKDAMKKYPDLREFFARIRDLSGPAAVNDVWKLVLEEGGVERFARLASYPELRFIPRPHPNSNVALYWYRKLLDRARTA